MIRALQPSIYPGTDAERTSVKKAYKPSTVYRRKPFGSEKERFIKGFRPKLSFYTQGTHHSWVRAPSRARPGPKPRGSNRSSRTRQFSCVPLPPTTTGRSPVSDSIVLGGTVKCPARNSFQRKYTSLIQRVRCPTTQRYTLQTKKKRHIPPREEGPSRAFVGVPSTGQVPTAQARPSGATCPPAQTWTADPEQRMDRY